jgi:hypothetical protein
MLLRGLVDLEEARERLRSAGYGWLDLQDNGTLPSAAGRFPGLEVPEVHAYHLLPAGVDKRSAVGLDRSERGLEPRACIAVGDSPSDAAVAPEVGAVFIVANGAAAVEQAAGDGTDSEPAPTNLYLLERSHGGGFADAVLPFLPARPAARSSPER